MLCSGLQEKRQEEKEKKLKESQMTQIELKCELIDDKATIYGNEQESTAQQSLDCGSPYRSNRVYINNQN
jgi:hypothetical protein